MILQAAKGPGDDVRAVGSDIKADEVVLPKGTVIGAAEVGLLATVGAAKLKVSIIRNQAYHAIPWIQSFPMPRMGSCRAIHPSVA